MRQLLRHYSPRLKAFALITTVLSLLVFSFTLALVGSQLTRGSLAGAGVVRSGAQALVLAEGCAEGILNELRKDPNYTDGSYSTSAGICNLDFRQDENDPSRYVLHVTADDGGVTKGVVVTVTRTDTHIELLSWLEE